MAAESSFTTCQEPKKTMQAFQIPLLSEDSQSLPNLPPEIIDAILSRLPVKSLLRLRCVCKSWDSLILNPKFVKTHVSLASMNSDYTHHRLLLISHGDVKSCSLRALLHEQSDTAVELDCPFEVSNRLIRVVGCCDGLVCMTIEREVFLWNPSTGKFITLPYVDYHYFAVYGFAYDESIDDYKVVVTFPSSSGCEVQVYTFRSDSWRRIGDFPHGVPPNDTGTFVNRGLHWTVTKESNNYILSLDLAMETYGEVLEPEYGDGCLYEICLEALNGCLCIVRYCNEDACADVWIMKEYGIRESWTKLVVVPYLSHQTERYVSHEIKRLHILMNGEVLLHVQSQLVRYSPKDGTFSHLTVHNCSAFFIADPYVESLVSPRIN